MNGGENFRSGEWDHRAIRSAVDALRPAESGAVAAAWDDLGRRFQESVTAFHDATRAAVRGRPRPRRPHRTRRASARRPHS